MSQVRILSPRPFLSKPMVLAMFQDKTKILKTVLSAFVFFVVGLCVIAAIQPDEFSYSRSATINAYPATIFKHVNNLQKWNAWSPWAKLDPNATNSFEGPAAGTGAVMRWSGNGKVGKGAMTITESRASERVRFRLDFEAPMKATNEAEFTFAPATGDTKGTVVTWTMTGKNNFMGKLMSIVFNCERMVGGQFEEGLANLKAVVEGK